MLWTGRHSAAMLKSNFAIKNHISSSKSGECFSKNNGWPSLNTSTARVASLATSIFTSPRITLGVICFKADPGKYLGRLWVSKVAMDVMISGDEGNEMTRAGR